MLFQVTGGLLIGTRAARGAYNNGHLSGLCGLVVVSGSIYTDGGTPLTDEILGRLSRDARDEAHGDTSMVPRLPAPTPVIYKSKITILPTIPALMDHVFFFLFRIIIIMWNLII